MHVNEKSKESNLEIQDVDKYVPNILYDMLTKFQMLKDDDVHILVDVEVGTTVTNCGGVINHDHAVEDMETLWEDVIILPLVCAIKSKVYGLFNKGTQSINDIYPFNDETTNSWVLIWSKLLLSFQETLCYLLKKMDVFVNLILLIILDPSYWYQECHVL